MMENNNWYTFQVTLHRKDTTTDQPEVHEFRDVTAKRLATLSRAVWTTGVWLKQSPKAWEVASPFMVKQVFIIKQDGRYSPIDEPEETL